MAKSSKRTFTTGLKLWISTGRSYGVFGEGKYNLLCGIAETGSLSKAAAALGISYRKAWGDIKKAETRLKRKLIIRERGGKGGGTSRLTPFAEDLLKAYGKFKEDIRVCADKKFKKYLSGFFK